VPFETACSDAEGKFIRGVCCAHALSGFAQTMGTPVTLLEPMFRALVDLLRPGSHLPKRT
jgi:hypothetical protein